jgi:pSer/pThr/pTyr-binding forkhead associated (FHA) protein
MRYSLKYGEILIPLARGQTVIGRSPGAKVYINDGAVSRRHAVLTVTRDEVMLEDLGSRLGVQVNGERLASPRKLCTGDRIGIGSHEIFLTDDAPSTRGSLPSDRALDHLWDDDGEAVIGDVTTVTDTTTRRRR